MSPSGMRAESRFRMRRLTRYGRATFGPLALIAAGVAALAVTIAAFAQSPFNIPADARSGRMTSQQLPLVLIDGKTYRLAPGARIFNRNRATLTPNLVPNDSPVKFVLDSTGQVQTVWLVDASELKPGERRTAPAGG